MNALILGGMSPRHKEWVRQVANELQPQFETVKALDYRHWDAPDTEMDLEYEIAQAAKLAEGLGEHVIVAKSIGTVITVLGNARGLLHPVRCVLLGFPHRIAVNELPQAGELAEALVRLPATAFVHNEHDPLGDAAVVERYVAEHAPAHYSFQTVPGIDTHDYVDFGLMGDLASGR